MLDTAVNLLIPVFALYLWISLEGPVRRRALAFAWFAATLAAWGLIVAATNHHRFGSILDLGYGAEGVRFGTPLSVGLYSLLIGSCNGLIFYAPVALLMPRGLWSARRSHRGETLLLSATFAVYVLTIAKWWGWEGGSAGGHG